MDVEKRKGSKVHRLYRLIVSQRFRIRTFSATIMAVIISVVVALGPRFVILAIIVLQTLLFNEIVGLVKVYTKKKHVPWSGILDWYLLFTTTYFLYGESLSHYCHELFVGNRFMIFMAMHHRLLSYSLYLVGIIMFVLNLKVGFYRYQFAQFASTHTILLFIICQSQFVINNAFEGLIWLIIPTILVVINDISAYLAGSLYGRTPLIKISPKKTWEGFAFALLVTIVASWFVSRFLVGFPFMICPLKNLSVTVFDNEDIKCERNIIFRPVEVWLPWQVTYPFGLLGISITSIYVYPIQWHSLVIAVFASIVSPFSGFLASGLKRTFNIKDFSDTIPGHGGLADRLDCHLLINVFVYLYVTTFLKTGNTTSMDIMKTILKKLDNESQIELYHLLRNHIFQ